MFQLKHLVGILSLGLTWAECPLGPNERLMVGQTFVAGTLDPTEGSTPWALTSHGIAEKLFTVDKDGEIVGQVGKSLTKVSDTIWEVTIQSGYKFSDGTSVDAEHVAASLLSQNQKNSGAQSSLGSLSATPMDDVTVRIESEKPTHIMDSVLAEWAFVVYTQDSEGNYIFTGPYVVEHFEAGDHIDLVPNEFYPGAAERPKIELKKFSSGHELAEAVEEKQVDIGFHLPIDTLPELRDVEGVSIKSFEVGYHYMAFYNTDTLSDVKVRQAIDLAIDRVELSQALAGGDPTRSLFPENSPYFADETDSHGDLSGSEALLDEAGWNLENGKRTKNGEVLSVSLVAYPHRPGLVIMQPVIAETLKDLGIEVETILTGDDWSETQQIIDDRTFDMLMWAQHTLPAGDPAWFLNAFFHSEGGKNMANFESTNVDTLLDNLSNAESHADRVFFSEAVQGAIQTEVPVSNLVTPFWHVSINDCVKDYEPYGSDYYVIRADLRANVEGEETSGSARVPVAMSVMAIFMGLLMPW